MKAIYWYQYRQYVKTHKNWVTRFGNYDDEILQASKKYEAERFLKMYFDKL